MKLLVDFTGRMLHNTGGRTYPSYMLPLWSRCSEDQIIALFSHGETPRRLLGLECITELPPSMTPGSVQRLYDLHVGVRRVMASTSLDAALFPGNVMPVTLPKELPAIVAIRSTIAFHYPERGHDRVRLRYLRRATAHAVRRANRIIVPSSSTADDLMRFVSAKRAKIVVIPHGIDHTIFRPASDGREDQGEAEFLFVSRPWDHKGLELVFRALRVLTRDPRFKHVRLAVADGGMQVDMSRRLEQFAASLAVDQHVRFLGAVDHVDLARFYSRARALVLPSAIESFGNSYLEAAACGCPVITARGHGTDETIGPVAWQVTTHRHDELAVAMERALVMDESERAELAERLCSWAGRFSWESTLRMTREVLAEVARPAR